MGQNQLRLFIVLSTLATGLTVWWVLSFLRSGPAGDTFSTETVVAVAQESAAQEAQTQRPLTKSPETSSATAAEAVKSPDLLLGENFPVPKRDAPPLENLRAMESCLRPSNPCDLDDDYPRHLEDQVSAQTLRYLRELRAQAANNSESAEVALWALHFPEDKVRLEGMEWAERFLAPRERAEAVIDSLSESTAVPLYLKGLHLLRESYPSAPARVDAFLEQTLKSGPHFAAEETARAMTHFLNDRNVSRFESLQKQLPKGSNTSDFLKSNLEDFRRRQGGG